MKTVLSFGAHPDDIEIGCAGAEILLRQKGYKIIHVIMTCGEEGAIDIPKEELAHKRENEAIAAANVIGVEKLLFLRYPDSLTGYDKAMKMQVISLIRQYAPDIIFTHATSDEFPDHKVVNQLVTSAITAAAGPWFADIKLNPHSVPEVLGYEVWHPMQHFQTVVSIGKVIDKKMEALACHQSQIKNVDYLSAAKGLAAYRGIMTMKSNYAEVFEVIKTDFFSLLPN